MNLVQLRDALFDRITQAALRPDIVALIGGNLLLEYEGRQKVNPANLNGFWCRASFQSVDEAQSGLRNAGDGNTRRMDGLLLVQVFAPHSAENAYDRGIAVADSLKKPFTDCSFQAIWLRNARVLTPPSESAFYKFTLVVEWQHDNFTAA
jgi:hypothetical protein